MTDNEGHGLGDAGRPWSVDQLADLHAGVLDDAEAARIRPEAHADPQAREVLAALERTRGQLADYGRVPPLDRVPDAVAARLDAAIAAEVRAHFGIASDDPGTAPGARFDTAAPDHGVRGSGASGGASGDATGSGAAVVDLAAARRRRNRRLGWASGIVAAAAAIVAIGVVAVPGLNQEQGTPVAKAPSAPQFPAPGGGQSGPLALSQGNLKQAAPSVLGARDYGPLNDPQRLAGCLAANNAGAPTSVAGIKPLTLDGRPGVLMLLTTGKMATFRLLVVSPDCAAGHPAMLADSTIGGTVPPTR